MRRALVGLILCSGCAQVLGLGDFQGPGDPLVSAGGAGGGATGGAGATSSVGGAGGAACTSPLDGRCRVPIFYTFEGFTPGDSVLPNEGPGGIFADLDVVESDGVVALTDAPADLIGAPGTAVALPPGVGFRAPSQFSEFDVADDASFAVGGWFRVAEDKAGSDSGVRIDMALGHYGTDAATFGGFAIVRRDNGAVRCSLRSDALGGDRNADSVASAWPFDTWIHVACVFDHVERSWALYVNGDLEDTAVPVDIVVANPAGRNFWIGGEVNDLNSLYAGDVDEVFFAPEALSDEVIARLHACGIDGRHCSCQDGGANGFAPPCGFRGNDCAALATCDAPFADL